MTGTELIEMEREHQIERGFDTKNDAVYTSNELIDAAEAHMSHGVQDDDYCLATWPWDYQFFKPTSRLENLVKAGALIAAEIDRLQHANPTDGAA
jgi:hypothetical protein